MAYASLAMSPPIRPLFTVPLLIGLAMIGGCGETSDGAAALPVTFVAAEVPADLDGGASTANLREAGLFAWQELIALNWPARPGTRDQADTDQPFGDPAFSGPLVWHTYRAKVEIAPGSGEPPGFVDDASQNFGYATVPPRYVYAAGEVPACTGQASLDQPAWINLDEVSQLLVNRLYAGAAPDDAARRARNSQPQRVRYVAKANGTMYGYVVDPATSYWKQGDAFMQATSNFLVVANGNGTPARPSGPVIQFPSGTIEVKGAPPRSGWRT